MTVILWGQMQRFDINEPYRKVWNSEILSRTRLSTIRDVTKKRCSAVFGHMARLPSSTPASQALRLRSIRHSTDFHTVPAGSTILVIGVVGGWISHIRTTTPLLTCALPCAIGRAGFSGATLWSTPTMS